MESNGYEINCRTSVAWFAVLAGLLHLGLGLRRGVWVVAFCVGVGLWDEWRQLSLPGRSAGWDDLLFDALGIALGVMLAGWLWRRAARGVG
jgi:VanZ family protein